MVSAVHEDGTVNYLSVCMSVYVMGVVDVDKDDNDAETRFFLFPYIYIIYFSPTDIPSLSNNLSHIRLSMAWLCTTLYPD